MDKNRIKDSIKKDILKNIDCIVDSIIDSMEVTGESKLPSSHDVADVIKIIRENDVESRRDLDYFLGKEEIPPPIIKEDGSVDVYTEIDIDDICDKIKLANDIFTHLYKWNFNKGDTTHNIPNQIKEIIGVYEVSLMYDKTNKAIKRDAARKWLMGIALVGIIRYRGLANSPYMLDNDIQKSIKIFFKSLNNVYNVLSGKKIMIDPEGSGLNLWDTKNTKNKKVSFRRKPNK